MCTPDVDPAWVSFVSNRSPPGDPAILDFEPDAVDSSHGPITCDEFNTWFDEDYRAP